MRILSFLLLLFVFSTAPAQDINTRFYGETAGADLLAKHTIALPDGGLLMAGTTNTTDTGGYRVLLLRCDGAGNTVWQRTYMRGTAFSVDASPGGGFIVGGRSERGAFQDVDGFVLRVDENGEEIWNKRILTGIRSSVTCVRAMPDGRFAACGNILNNSPEKSLDAFLTILDQDGATAFYEKKSVPTPILGTIATEIVVSPNNEITLAWGENRGNIISRFSAIGQLKWEKNFQGSSFDIVNRYITNNMATNEQGDIIILGYKHGIGNALITLSGLDGTQITETNYKSIGVTAINIVPVAGGADIYYTAYISDLADPLSYFPALIRLRTNMSGSIINADTLKLVSADISQIVVRDDLTIFLYEPQLYLESEIQFAVIKKQLGSLFLADKWNFSTGFPASNDYYETSCKSNNGGYFAVGRKGNFDTHEINYHVIKTDDAGNVEGKAMLGISALSRGVKIQPLADGGAIVISPDDTIWRLSATAAVVWEKPLPYGFLFTDSQNGFSVVSETIVSDNSSSYTFRKYNSSGDLLEEHDLFGRLVPRRTITGGAIHFSDHFTLLGNRYFIPDQTYRNVVFTLDENGHLKSEVMQDEKYSVLFNPGFFRSKTGVLLATEIKTSKNEMNEDVPVVYTLCIKKGAVIWDHQIYAFGSESLNIVGIDDAPCGGYVMSVTSKAQYRNYFYLPSPAIHDLTLLQHIKEDGSGGQFFTYHPYPEPFTHDTAFIPGYTYKEWGSQLNGQTSDWYFRTISFPSGKTVHTENNHLGIMPNPSSGHTCLEFVSEKNGPLEVTVADASGRVVDRFDNFKTDAVWMMPYRANLPAGVYVISIRFPGEKPVTEQWVKVR